MTNPDDIRPPESGQESPLEELLEVAYGEMRAIGRVLIAASRGHSIQGTELVHEAVIKLKGREYESSRHFSNAVAQAMRQVLTDRARARNAIKRPSHLRRQPSEAIESVPATDGAEPAAMAPDVLAAVDALADSDSLAADALRLWLTGLTREEIATSLSTSGAEVRKRLAAAKAYVQIWLERGNR